MLSDRTHPQGGTVATHADDGITFDRLTDDVDAVIGLAAEAWYLPDGCSDLASATFGDVELTDEERDRIARLTTGDDQRIDVTVGEGAALQVTTQAFEKVHRMEGERSARRVTRLAVGSRGYLDNTLYEPQGSCAPELAPMDMEGMGTLRGVHAPR